MTPIMTPVFAGAGQAYKKTLLKARSYGRREMGGGLQLPYIVGGAYFPKVLYSAL
jgi:hypothetical protein